MKQITRYGWLVGLVCLVAGCASGPKYAQVCNTFPAVGPEQGRIFVYRTTALGAAVQPDVKLNDEKIGSAKPKGFFYADRPPGDYRISTSTEVKRTLSLTLDKAQTRYVRLNMSIGFFVGHCYPELVEPDVGAKEIQKCSFIGEGASKK
jgi:hypothetical protein